MSKTAVLSVRIVSDAKKANEGFKRAAGAGDKFGNRIKKMAAGVIGALGFKKVTQELWDMGAMFDSVWDDLRVGTGASGDALAGLQDSVRSVAAEIPAMDGGIEQISSTLGDVNTRLGLTGPELEEVTSQFVTLSNLGVDADIDAVGSAMNSFGVEAAAIPGELDKLFQISQSTGVSVTDLANSAVKAGPGLRQFGFDMGDSAAMVGLMDKAGIDADGTLGRLQRALGEFAAEGRDAPEALRETVTEIDNFIEAGDMAAAYDMAESLFGTRGATQFIDAVGSGTLSIDDFGAAAGLTEDTILGLGEEVESMPEKWQRFKQEAALALEPIAEWIFNALETPLEHAGTAVEMAGEGFNKLTGFIQDNMTWIAPLAAMVGGMAAVWGVWAGAVGVWNGIMAAARTAQLLFNVVMAANPAVLFISLLVGIAAAIVVAYQKSDTFRNFIDRLWETAKRVFDRIRGVIDTVVDAFQSVVDIVGNVINAISNISFPSPPAWLSNMFSPGLGPESMLGVPGDSIFRFMAPPASTFAAGPADLTAARASPSLADLTGAVASPGGRVTVDNSVNVTVDGSGIVDARRVAEAVREALSRDGRNRGGRPASGGGSVWR